MSAIGLPIRGLGWDIDSPYSSNRGELFPIGSYGHTGFTGTSVWIDPSTKTYVILLANSVHPDQRPALNPLRSKVATIAAAAAVELRGLLKPLLKHQPLPADMAFPAGSSSPVALCAAGVIVAAISGYFAIGMLDRFTRKPRLNGFAVYCLGLGLVMLALGTTGMLGHH